ncbi:MAG: fumarate hydratase [Hydrogenophilus sp.]|nr:fumarate hydratase [Hydrogenophilus sp.]
MTLIREEDLITSIADAFQYISVYHPLDFIRAMGRAYEQEQNPAAKDAIAQILTNSRLAAEGRRPICQDTGIAVVFLEIGQKVQIASDRSLQELVDEGVRRAYTNPFNPLRASVLADPAGERRNTRDNTPAVLHIESVPGDMLRVTCAAKGGGSENKAKFAVLNPSDSVADWVVESVAKLGAGWCPPGIIGVGIGGTPEKAMFLAKKALMAPVDIGDLQAKAAAGLPLTTLEHLRLEIYERLNRLGIGAQGLGGLTTVLDVKILDHPTHAASLPVALIPNCAATRHIHFTLDGSGPARFVPPSLEEWPAVTWTPDPAARPVDLATLTRDEVARWRAGDRLLLTGKLLTARDAAHKRLITLLSRGEPLPVDLTNRVLYYVGPVDPVASEAVGPAGPTTATRMDPFTPLLLEKTGLLATIGKAERGPDVVSAIAKNRAAYLIAVGGAAYLVAKAIRSARVVAFPDLGMEAIYEFEVHEMPVTVAVDSEGRNIHAEGPAAWRVRLQSAFSLHSLSPSA